MDNVIKRAGDKLRVSVKSIRFVSEHQGRVNVAETAYNVQGKNTVDVEDPESGKVRKSTHVYKKITESMDVATEPLISDLLYLNKFVMEYYYASLMGLNSEAETTVLDITDNRVLKLLAEHVDTSKQTTIFDRLKD